METKDNLDVIDGIIEDAPVDEKESLEAWLLEVTKAADLAGAKAQVERGLQGLEIFPRMGTVTMLIGPGGLMNVQVQQNLMEEGGIDDLEAAFLEIQRQLLQLRRQKK